MTDVLIRCENVSKKFCRDLKSSLWYGLKDAMGDLTSSNGSSERLRPGEFWANRKIDFSLARGECVGLIGRNGAGKTTLLKLLSGLIKPDVGQLTIRGRVGALIALGAGFSPILTGRENIYINGSVLGIGRSEIDAMLSDIIDFAEIGDAIDAPVRTYSSGMSARLGFAIASSMQPSILLVDEVLAVGDPKFRTRCYRRIGTLIDRGVGVILVSHSLPQITRLCDRSILLERGQQQSIGRTADIIGQYLESHEKNIATTATRYSPSETTIGISRYPAGRIAQGDQLVLRIEVHTPTAITGFVTVIITGETQNGVAKLVFRSCDNLGFTELKAGTNVFSLTMPQVCLGVGWYSVKVALAESQLDVLAMREDFQFFVGAHADQPENTHFQVSRWSMA